jgi:hypothetical protein
MALSKLAQKLNDARRAVALFTRLQDAERHTEAHCEADAAATHVGGVSDVRVADTSPPAAGEGLLHRSFQITWNRLAGRGGPKRLFANGFHGLPAPVMLCLQEKYPEQIPAAIMALAPDDTRQAFALYATARLRGYL